MSAFRKFGITHLSPSSVNCWRDTPGIWCLRYLLRVKDEGGAPVWRGNAVERGVEMILRGATLAEAQAMASETFEAVAFGEISDAIDAERKLIPGMVAKARDWHADMLGAKSIEPLAATQLRVETYLDGVPVPFIGYVDFTFMEGADVDCKSTKACPSKPRPDHVRQVALYWRARERPAALLYVTDKRFAYFTPSEEELAAAIDDLTASAKSLERFLSAMPDAETAVRCLPMPVDHYAFGPAYKEALGAMA